VNKMEALEDIKQLPETAIGSAKNAQLYGGIAGLVVGAAVGGLYASNVSFSFIPKIGNKVASLIGFLLGAGIYGYGMSSKINRAELRSLAQVSGIVVAGRANKNRYYILEDCSLRGSPDQWIRRAILKYHEYQADRIIAEVNNGGDLVENLLRNTDRNVSFRSVRATRGKVIRAEPISALYEQKRVHHFGIFSELEEQMCQFTGNNVKSQHDDRVDALVWAITSLQSSGQAIFRIS